MDMATQICSALKFLENKGIIHGDLVIICSVVQCTVRVTKQDILCVAIQPSCMLHSVIGRYIIGRHYLSSDVQIHFSDG